MKTPNVSIKKVKDPFLVRDRRIYKWIPDMWVCWDEERKEYSKEPKTQHEWFIGEYERYKKDFTFTEWKRELLAPYQDVLIDRYVREGFWLISLICLKKSPSEDWAEENRLDRRGAMRWMVTGGNLGVICGNRSDGLICIDIDEKSVPRVFKRLLKRTLTTKTLRGYHLYFRADELPRHFADTLRRKYGRVECIYTGRLSALPLSVHPESTKKNLVFYDFLDYRKPILNLEELLEVM